MFNLKKELIEALQQSSFDKIVQYIMDMSGLLVSDMTERGEKLPNDENRIRSIILEEYLDNEVRRKINRMLSYRFTPENMENYSGAGSYLGRTDIRITLTTEFKKNNAYYIVECKRIDGTDPLNKKYVEEGVGRFVRKKYSSYYGRNLMFGFVVKRVNIPQNTKKIENIQKTSKDPLLHGDIKIVGTSGVSEHYRCIYNTVSGELELRHIFADFSSVI